MLEEILRTVSASPRIDKVVVVTRDETAAGIGARFGSTILYDGDETGVNEAVELADEYLQRGRFDASIVIPQDIPYIKTQDIDFMMNFVIPPNFAVIVPSQKFDGTNALMRMPINLMETYYDDNSYREHVRIAKNHTRNVAPILMRRIMLDVDTRDDVRLLLEHREKPHIADKIEEIVGPALYEQCTRQAE